MTVDEPTFESPQGKILNYSIVSSDEDENPLVVRLKVSQKNKIPRVMLKRLEDDSQYALSPRSSSKVPKVKQSEEFKMDFVSGGGKLKPIENLTPKKKKKRSMDSEDVEMVSPNKRSCSNIDDLCTEILEKVKLKTPLKRALIKDGLNEVTPKKTEPVTPRRRVSRNLATYSPLKTEDAMGKRQSRAPIRYIDEYSPKKSVKANLNESFRRSVLRTRHNLENITCETTIRRSTRKSRAGKFYDSEDEAIELAEALKKSEIEVSASNRVLRSRSNSTVSNDSVASDSDGSFKPKRRICKASTIKDKSPEKVPKTPKNKQGTFSTPKSVSQTPKNRLKMLREGTITPSMHSRSSTILTETTPLMKARQQLHVSYVPTSLPCREKEYQNVYGFLRGKLEDECGGCMYISGVPGTGKTATVTSVIDSLMNDRKVVKFNYVSINGMRLSEPRQAYVEIWKQLTGKTVPWEQAQSLLEQQFTKKKNQKPVVMLIDELDILCTKRQDVVYNLLDWPTKCKDQLIMITIANTMDLPERLLMSRVTSRLGLTRLTFQAYSHKQLMEIVTKRIAGTDSFNSDAVQLVARKVASVSGDARRALDICRRAAEIAEEAGETQNNQQVSIKHINEALTAMVTQPQVVAIRRCSRLQKLLLQAIVAEIERTGVEETTFADVLRMLVSCCALDGFKMASGTVTQRALCQLSACKLILTDQKCGDIYQRIILNVSVHDVYFALKKE